MKLQEAQLLQKTKRAQLLLTNQRDAFAQRGFCMQFVVGNERKKEYT